MLNGGGGSSTLQHRNAMLEELEAVDVESLAPEQLGAELKFICSTVDLLQLQAARRLAAFDRRS